MAEQPFVVQPPGDAKQTFQAAAVAARLWALPQPELLRTGMNALFTAGDHVVLRVGRPTSDPTAAIWLADRLGAAGISVARFARREPAVVGDLTVFAMERAQVTGPIDWFTVGQMVARVHAIDAGEVSGRYPAPSCSSFAWWQFDELLDDLGPMLDVDARRGIDDALALHGDWCDHVERVVLCHGDVHPGNVLQTADGPLLIDWDLMCVGPAAWDHAPMMTWADRWGGVGGEYEALAGGYGESMRGHPMAEALATLRLLAATLMRVRAARTDPAAAVEAEHRLRWWRGEPDAPQWRAT